MTDTATAGRARARARFRIAVPSWTFDSPKQAQGARPKGACREEFKRLLDAHLEPCDLHRSRLERRQRAAIKKIRSGLYGYSD